MRSRDHHDFDEAGGLILHERSPINPKSIYATSKVAADFLTMNYHDAFEVPGVVTRMFNNYGPRQNPRYVTGTIITQALTRDAVELGNLEPLRDFCFCLDGVRGHLTVAAHGKPGDVYVYGQGENISMREWAELILRIGEEHGLWPGDRHLTSVPGRFRPGGSDVLALRVGHEKLTRETGWKPLVSWEDGILETIRWYAANRERWIGRVDWLPTASHSGRRGSDRPREPVLLPARQLFTREVALLEAGEDESSHRRDPAVVQDHHPALGHALLRRAPASLRLGASIVEVDVDGLPLDERLVERGPEPRHRRGRAARGRAPDRCR